ncbi:MAG: hypothetical protein P8O03_03115 [Ilumatobacter sp.]|nr:hypothetical protein [Ilumatobacter sp.]
MTPEEFAVWRKQLTRTVRTKLELCPDEGCDCILWTGALDSSQYASFKMKGTVRIVHRYVYEKLVGPIELVTKSGELDPDATIDHLCTGHRNCQNPAHMEVVSRTENSIRANHRRHVEGFRHE